MLQTANGDPMPAVKGPLQGSEAQPLHVDHFSPPPGYTSQQYVVEGTSGGEPYRTLIRVLRPSLSSLASGVTIVEPWHPAGHWTVYSKVERYLVRSGHVAVVVVSNRHVLETRIKPQNPALYGGLMLSGLDGSDSEVIAQVGALLRSGSVPDVCPTTMILAGQSLEGFWTRRYIEEQHRFAQFDGQPVYDGYFPAQSALGNVTGPIVEVDVPVIELQGESEVIRYFERGADRIVHRKEGGEHYRLYEVPGMAHVATRAGANAARTAELRCPHDSWSNFPLHEIFHLALDNLVRWITENLEPPAVSPIATTDGGRTIVRDEHGNAVGGLRTSLLDVPNRTVHATSGPYPEREDGPRCDFFGWDDFFSAAKLRSLYGSHDEYVKQVELCLDELIGARWFLSADAQDLRDEAMRDLAYWQL